MVEKRLQARWPPPRDPCTPGRALGGSREQGGPEAGVRPPHAGRAGSGGSRDTVRWGVQTAREEEVPEEGSHVSKPEKARENCRQVSRRVSKSTGRRVCPAHGGLVGRCPSVSFPPPHSERGRHSGTPVPPGGPHRLPQLGWVVVFRPGARLRPRAPPATNGFFPSAASWDSRCHQFHFLAGSAFCCLKHETMPWSEL